MCYYNTCVLDISAFHLIAQTRSPESSSSPSKPNVETVFLQAVFTVLYKIIPMAPAGIFRVLSIGDLVAGPLENWCSSLCACVWHTAQTFCTSHLCLTGRQNSFQQACLHTAPEKPKSSDAFVKEDTKCFCYSKSCVC